MKKDSSKKTCSQGKMGQVMSEYKKGTLKSSSGSKVKNPKQAIAIGLSESRAKCGYPAQKKTKKK
jgi:hypothetical protein